MTSWIVRGLAAASVLVLAACGEQSDGQGADRPVPDPLRIATEGAYPPYNMTDAAGNLTGFDVDVVREVCARIKVECRIVAQNWDGIIPGLQTGKYDAIAAGMSITEERERVVAFTQGYATTPAYFVALNDSPLQDIDTGLERVNLTDLDEAEKAALATLRERLKGRTVGVQSATIHANFLDEYLAGTVSVRRYDTQENLALDLAAGRIDAGLADASAWEAFLDSPEGRNASFFGPGFDGGLFGRGMGIAIRQNEPALLDALNGALASMQQDGTLKRLSEQWFGFDASMPAETR